MSHDPFEHGLSRIDRRTLSIAHRVHDLLGSDGALSTERSAININHALADIEGIQRRMFGPSIGFTVSLVANSPFVIGHSTRIHVDLPLAAGWVPAQP